MIIMQHVTHLVYGVTVILIIVFLQHDSPGHLAHQKAHSYVIIYIILIFSAQSYTILFINSRDVGAVTQQSVIGCELKIFQLFKKEAPIYLSNSCIIFFFLFSESFSPRVSNLKVTIWGERKKFSISCKFVDLLCF